MGRKRRALAALLPLFLCGAAPARAADAGEPARPMVTLLRVTNRGADVFLKFELAGVLNPELARRIEAGLETTIRYEIRLYRQYRYWFDTFLDSRRYDVSVTFDPVTREYVVVETLDDKPLARATTADFEDVKRRLVSGENLLAFHVRPEWPRRNLVVHMRAAFDSKYLFAFIPVDSRTSWKKSQKFVVPAPAGAP
ncbi:MAG TPA: DUF4390 domain-containing protein [Thermoanaerobaculia bacterium]|nr:DUF4390 domain-containing protein [Thermoanaerobaculia bacterium]